MVSNKAPGVDPGPEMRARRTGLVALAILHAERLAACIGGMQQLMRPVRVGLLEELVVELYDLRIVVRLAQRVALVLGIEGARAFGTVGIDDVHILVGEEAVADDGHAAAVDAAAGAAHDLDEVVRARVLADLVEQDLGVCHAGGHRHLDV